MKTVTCEKCGKPLGMFNGKICYECEKKAHEDFKQYCAENNYVPLTTEMYSRAIKTMDVLDKIKAEIELAISDNEKYKNDYTQGVNDGLCHALHIISEYRRKSK